MFRRKTATERAAAAVESALDAAGRKIAKAKKQAGKQLAAAEKSATREATKAKKAAGRKVAAVQKAASRTATAVAKTARRKVADAKKGWAKLEPEQRDAILASGATLVAAAVSAVRRPAKKKSAAKRGA